MIVYDCESEQSTLRSIESVTGVPTDSIQHFLREIDLDESRSDEDDKEARDGPEVLLRRWSERFGDRLDPVDAVMWFHFTRALPLTRFEDGLLPLKGNWDPVWATILQVFPVDSEVGRNLVAMRSSGIPNAQAVWKKLFPMLQQGRSVV